jgi:uncharacterized membrane protein
LLITLLLTIEARRVSFFRCLSQRVRGLERQWYAQIFAPEPEGNPEWLRQLAADLRKPSFHLTPAAGSIAPSAPQLWMVYLSASGLVLKTSSNGRSQEGSSHLVSSFMTMGCAVPARGSARRGRYYAGRGILCMAVLHRLALLVPRSQ